MRQEDKELLLEDLSARVKHGVYIRHGINGKSILTGIEYKKRYKRWIIIAEGAGFHLDDIKPYLRPMSSMTEEEKKEMLSFFQVVELNSGLTPLLSALKSFEYINWLNKHHFDYRGLIEKGLALEAPEGMYDTKIQ